MLRTEQRRYKKANRTFFLKHFLWLRLILKNFLWLRLLLRVLFAITITLIIMLLVSLVEQYYEHKFICDLFIFQSFNLQCVLEQLLNIIKLDNIEGFSILLGVCLYVVYFVKGREKSYKQEKISEAWEIINSYAINSHRFSH